MIIFCIILIFFLLTYCLLVDMYAWIIGRKRAVIFVTSSGFFFFFGFAAFTVFDELVFMDLDSYRKSLEGRKGNNFYTVIVSISTQYIKASFYTQYADLIFCQYIESLVQFYSIMYFVLLIWYLHQKYKSKE